MQDQKYDGIVIGSGVAGMSTAITLANVGHQILVVEQNDFYGGKLAELHSGGFRFDMGPSLFTQPQWVEDLFRSCGKNPKDYFDYNALEEVCRYYYDDQQPIKAFANIEAFAQEIEAKTADSAEAVLKYFDDSKEIYEMTTPVFLEKSLHQWATYWNTTTFKAALKLHRLDNFRSLHKAHLAYFKDKKTIQLFDRFATYNGSNPYEAPATLKVIPYLEHGIGAYVAKGGMYAIMKAMKKLADELGIEFSFGHAAEEIVYDKNQAIKGLQTSKGFIASSCVISNVDVHTTYEKLMPKTKSPFWLKKKLSTSALIFYLGVKGNFPELGVHNIFFSGDYKKEFDALFKHKVLDDDPTVYLYISSKFNASDAPEGHENWFLMVNTPPHFQPENLNKIRRQLLKKVEKSIGRPLQDCVVFEDCITPGRLSNRTGSMGGALYGNHSNDMMAAFMRHSNFSRRFKGLYFTGGSVHPGGGIPLCIKSGQITAAMILNKK